MCMLTHMERDHRKSNLYKGKIRNINGNCERKTKPSDGLWGSYAIGHLATDVTRIYLASKIISNL